MFYLNFVQEELKIGFFTVFSISQKKVQKLAKIEVRPSDPPLLNSKVLLFLQEEKVKKPEKMRLSIMGRVFWFLIRVKLLDSPLLSSKVLLFLQEDQDFYICIKILISKISKNLIFLLLFLFLQKEIYFYLSLKFPDLRN